MYDNNENQQQQQTLHEEIIASMWREAWEWLAAFEAKKQEEDKNNVQ